MTERRRYHSFTEDSRRWDRYEFRADDIVIATPPKCGTTWMQTLIAYLVFGGTDLPEPMSQLSPWLDMTTNDLDEVLAQLDAQPHRRFIKTHTGLDGLPYDERVSYVVVARDPRSVAFSWDAHRQNTDLGALIDARARATGFDDLAELGPPPGPPPDDPSARFRMWVDADPAMGAVVAAPLPGMLAHLHSFWERRDAPNIELFHYADLVADLPREYARLAAFLGLAVDADRIAALADAASFAAMKEQADRLAPDVHNRIFLDNARFFAEGPGRRPDDVLTPADQRYYDEAVARLGYDADFVGWVEHGRRAVDPAR